MRWLVFIGLPLLSCFTSTGEQAPSLVGEEIVLVYQIEDGEEREAFLSRADSIISLYQPHMPASDRYRIGNAVWGASSCYVVNPYLLLGLLACESGFDSMAVSDRGALGIAQFMPSTWRWVCEKTGIHGSPFQVEPAIYGAAFCLSDAYLSTGSMDRALCAYSGFPYGSLEADRYIAKVRQYLGLMENE